MFTKLIVVIAVVFLVIGLYSWDGGSLSDLVGNVASSTPTTTPSSVADTPAKPTVPKPAVVTAGAGARTFENGFYVTTIYLTSKGFEPALAEISHGEEVRFVNKTKSIMYVVADETSSSLYYRSIKQSGTIPKQDTYQLGLPETGVFKYYNLNSSPRMSGQIIIK